MSIAYRSSATQNLREAYADPCQVFVQSSISKTNVRLLQKTEERGELVAKTRKNADQRDQRLVLASSAI